MAREQRKLAAIVAADVVGYSRLMGRDESGTLARLRKNRSERLDPVLAKYGGRLVKQTGDGALIEFASAVDALSAGIEFQQAMAEASAEQPADTALVFRMGLHLGDLIVDGDDLYGDGMNIASRLEAEAPAGGIVISRTVHEAVTGRLKATFDDLGSLALKNIERPVQAFEVKWNPADWRVSATTPAAQSTDPAPSTTDVALALPDKPSIAVLPFVNMSGDPEQEYFTDGITEDIITELSRFQSLFVIARNSSFSYKGRSPNIQQVGKELGVQYVLEGSIRKSSNRIRVTGQLIDTLTGNHIWAERYDRVLEDIFAVQEELTRAIVAAIAPQIESTEQFKAARRRPENLSAYEIAVRAWAHALEGQDKADPTLFKRSIREAKEALAIDPNSVRALHVLAWAHGNTVQLRIAADRDQAVRESTWATARAIELDGMDAYGYAFRGLSALHFGRLDYYPEAIANARRAHEMNPNDTFVLRILATLEVTMGEFERAIERFHQVMRLNPRDPRGHITYQVLAFACFGAKRYAEGVEWASRAVNDRPKFAQALGSLAVCLVGIGEIDKAKAAFRALQEVASDEYLRHRLESGALFIRPEDRERSITFMRIAAGLEDPSAAEPLR
ncbi:MAG: adenylate/guanylate cyclase domain-containing protein [Hyphomicrobiaceae bacterium]